jgi:osmotically-inducible protein OsmY
VPVYGQRHRLARRRRGEGGRPGRCPQRLDDIQISYDIDPVDVDLHVQEALDRLALVPDGSHVTADTKDKVITLTGHVRMWAEHDAVLGAALMAGGVIDVRDNLQVTG